MKLFCSCFILLNTLFLCGQEKSYTLKELDSITTTKEIPRDSSYNAFPIYKGCEKWINFEGKKNCMNEKIKAFYKEHFNSTLPADLNIPSGKIEIFVSFKVDEQGYIIAGKAEGPHPYFETEALRVLKRLPKLTPGYLKGNPIITSFSIPVVAMVENTSNETVIKTYPVYRGCKKDLSFEETKKCTKEKILDYITVSFNYELADKLFPTDQSTQFYVEFTINKKGKTENINVQAHHKAIAVDVIQLIKRMPKFKIPGTTNGTPSDTVFNVLMTVHL